MNNIKIIRLAGKNSYDFGYAIGKETAREIKALLEKTEYIHDCSKTEANEAYVEFKEMAQKLYPTYFEELQGMAMGAGVDFDLLLKLNIPELDMFITDQDKVGYDDCTTLVRAARGRVQVLHNEDGGSDDGIYLFEGALPSGLQVVCVAYYGYLLGFAANLTARGIFYNCNSLKCKFQRLGIPKRFVTRDALESMSYADFLKRITVKGRAQAQNYIFVEKGKAYDIETSSRGYYAREVKGNFAHANNFLFRDMLKYEGRSHRGVGTFLRSSFARSEVKKVADFSDMKKILSSHVNRPSCVCAHGRDVGDINLTLGVIYFDSEIPDSFLLGYGPTCEAEMKKYGIVP